MDSIEAAENLLQNNLRFTGIIKISTSRFSVAHFGRQEMLEKGEYNTLQTKAEGRSGEQNIVAVCWQDCNRRNFVSTTGRTSTTVVQRRVRWRQHEDGACPVEVSISMPELVSNYYAVAGAIDSHNRIRQDSLDLEKMIEVKDWSFRIHCSLLGVVLTDSWLLYKFGTSGISPLKPHVFRARLGTELAFNTFDSVGVCRCPLSSTEQTNALPVAGGGMGIHLTPTKKRRAPSNNSEAKKQKLCVACPRGSRRKSSWLCSDFRLMQGCEVHLCHTQIGRNCFMKHIGEHH